MMGTQSIPHAFAFAVLACCLLSSAAGVPSGGASPGVQSQEWREEGGAGRAVQSGRSLEEQAQPQEEFPEEQEEAPPPHPAPPPPAAADAAAPAGAAETGKGGEAGADRGSSGSGEESTFIPSEVDRESMTPEVCQQAISDYVRRETLNLDKANSAAGQSGGEQGSSSPDEIGQNLRTLLFFLHVPRTGGRTYHQCFLKPLFPVGLRCPRSYDKLRFDPHSPPCRLLASHHDYSLMSRLPAPNVSVVTNMRHPVDRVLSAYEFAMENAARSLRWVPKLNPGETIIQARRKARTRFGPSVRTETRSVWPWSLLIPLLEDDLWIRRNSSLVPPPPLGFANLTAYEKSYLMMPLHEFVEHPFTHDLLHNGATFQVAGITQNSALKEAPFLRMCAMSFPDAARPLLNLAKARLVGMLHVGLTEVHQDSAVLFAATIGRSMRSHAFLGPDPKLLALAHQNMRHSAQSPTASSNFSVALERIKSRQAKSSRSILDNYKACVQVQRGRYERRRSQSQRLLGPVEFSAAERNKIPSFILNRIRELNSLDMDLLDYARQVFKREQQEYAAQIAAVLAEKTQGPQGPAEGGERQQSGQGRRRLRWAAAEEGGARRMDGDGVAASMARGEYRRRGGRVAVRRSEQQRQAKLRSNSVKPSGGSRQRGADCVGRAQEEEQVGQEQQGTWWEDKQGHDSSWQSGAGRAASSREASSLAHTEDTHQTCCTETALS